MASCPLRLVRAIGLTVVVAAFGAAVPGAFASCVGSNAQTLEETGSAGDPYRVGSVADLRAVGTGTCALTSSYSYLQTADITMPAAVAAGGVESNLTPIANESGTGPQFHGTYDGGGYRITGFVYVDGRGGSVRSDVGLFANIGDGAVIRRVHLRGARVGGGDHVAPLIGMIEDTSGSVVVEDVSATGTATGRLGVGGLIGKISAFSNVSLVGGTADVDVSADNSGGREGAGGAIGMVDAEDGAAVVVDDVHATGDVTVARLGGNALGGLIGYLRLQEQGGTSRSEPLAITDATAAGAVAAPQGGIAGGLVGLVQSNSANRAVRFERVAATGDVSGIAEVGGLIGLVQRSVTTAGDGRVDVIDSYARGDLVETDASGSLSFGGLVGFVSNSAGDTGGLFALEQVYATGAVPSGGKGLIGRFTYRTDQGTSAYWDVETTGRTDGGMAIFASGGRTTEQMRAYAQYADSVFAWSIVRLWQTASVVKTWGICASVNDGYPFLLMEYDAMPCAAPAAPTGLAATAGDARATVSFTAGGAGDSAITGYEASVDGAAWTGVSGTSSPLAVTGLANGRSQSIRLRALSAVGAGVTSAAIAVTPAAPSATPGELKRTRVTALPNGRIRVRFTVTGPGRIAVTGLRAGTAKARAKPVCSANAIAKAAGVHTLFCVLNRSTRAALAKAPLALRIRAAFTPTGGTTTAWTQPLTLPRTPRR
ncbi:MAG: hypothetical protein ACR2J9_05750 [Gaiellales bacterium]